MTTRRRKKPAYLLHKPTGQARVRLNGKDVYLGTYGSAESRERYDALIREWLLANSSTAESGTTMTIDDLALPYVDQVEQYYRHPDGSLTSEVGSIKAALRFLVSTHGTTTMYGDTPARDFGPLALEAVRGQLVLPRIW